jgi:hypothetical protein
MTERWVQMAKSYVAECSFPDYSFAVTTSATTRAVYLQGSYFEADTESPMDVDQQFTRRWFLSPEMSKSEIVSTVFKCVMTSMEHRVREWFLYENKPIFHPHHDVDRLLAICEARQERARHG